MLTLFKDSEKHQCFMACCTVSCSLASVRCGHLGSVIVKISTYVWYGLFHTLNVLHRKQINTKYDRKKQISAHSF